jgi:hypothetical protein
MSFDELVRQLVLLSRDGYKWGNDNGYPRIKHYPQYAQIRHIGSIIQNKAGFRGMQNACATLKMEVLLPPGHGVGSYIAEYAWDGIGGWTP